MSKSILVALIAFSFLGVPCYGQNVPDLSGTWKLDLSKSDYGDMPGPNERTDVIEQHGSNISESILAEQRHKTQRYILRFTTDGTINNLAPADRIHTWPLTVQSISSTWQGSSLLVVEGVKFQGLDQVARTRYTLSAGHNVLTMTWSLSGKETTATFVFLRIARK